jgi:hypothetical protein
MTVKQLRKILFDLPDDLIVEVFSAEEDCTVPWDYRVCYREDGYTDYPAFVIFAN